MRIPVTAAEAYLNAVMEYSHGASGPKATNLQPLETAGSLVGVMRAKLSSFVLQYLMQVVLECVNKELGYTPDLADVWDKAGLREAWVFISDTEKEYPFIGGILLVDALKKARRLPNQKMDIERRRQEAAEYRRKPPLIEDDEIPEGIIKASQHFIEEAKELHKDKFIIEPIGRRHRKEVDYSQVGGLAPLSGNDKYPAAVTGRTQSYMGCVRNLFISSELYDLGVPGFASNEHTQMGCDLSEAVCWDAI